MEDLTNDEIHDIMLDGVVSCSLKYKFLTAYLLAKETAEYIYGVYTDKVDELVGKAYSVLKELESKGYVRNNGSVYEQIKGFDNSEFVKNSTSEQRRKGDVMEKQYKNEDYAKFILENLEENNNIGKESSPFNMACDCIDYYEDREDLSYHDRCAILAIAYDLLEHLKNQGYFREEGAVYVQVKNVKNLELTSVRDVGNVFEFDLSEKQAAEEPDQK